MALLHRGNDLPVVPRLERGLPAVRSVPGSSPLKMAVSAVKSGEVLERVSREYLIPLISLRERGMCRLVKSAHFREARGC